MRLASFNILHGQPVRGTRAHATAHTQSPVDGPPDSSALLKSIAELAPTVLGLQEVDFNQARSGHADQTRLAAASLGAADWRFVPTVVGTPGGRMGFRPATEAERTASFSDNDAPHEDPQYGVSLISTLPVKSWDLRVFPAAPLWLPLLVQADHRPRMIRVRDEPRAAIAATIESPLGLVTFVTAHLSFVPGYNMRQLRQIREWLIDFPRPLFLLGDFNLPGTLPVRATGMTSLLRQPTFPSYRPRIQFDHIMADGLTDKQASKAASTARIWPLDVSDHCAVSVDVQTPAGT